MSWDLLVFIILFIAIILFISLYSRRNPSAKEQYDERQEMIRKNAYKYSAMTMILCSVVYFFITNITEKSFARDGVGVLLVALIGIAVFAIYSIFKDAFFGIGGKGIRNGNPYVYIVILVIVIVGNGIGAVRMIREHQMIQNGLLTANVMNLALAALFLLILISLGIKYVLNRKEMHEEE